MSDRSNRRAAAHKTRKAAKALRHPNSHSLFNKTQKNFFFPPPTKWLPPVSTRSKMPRWFVG